MAAADRIKLLLQFVRPLSGVVLPVLGAVAHCPNDQGECRVWAMQYQATTGLKHTSQGCIHLTALRPELYCPITFYSHCWMRKARFIDLGTAAGTFTQSSSQNSSGVLTRRQ